MNSLVNAPVRSKYLDGIAAPRRAKKTAAPLDQTDLQQRLQPAKAKRSRNRSARTMDIKPAKRPSAAATRLTAPKRPVAELASRHRTFNAVLATTGRKLAALLVGFGGLLALSSRAPRPKKYTTRSGQAAKTANPDARRAKLAAPLVILLIIALATAWQTAKPAPATSTTASQAVRKIAAPAQNSPTGGDTSHTTSPAGQARSPATTTAATSPAGTGTARTASTNSLPSAAGTGSSTTATPPVIGGQGGGSPASTEEPSVTIPVPSASPVIPGGLLPVPLTVPGITLQLGGLQLLNTPAISIHL